MQFHPCQIYKNLQNSFNLIRIVYNHWQHRVTCTATKKKWLTKLSAFNANKNIPAIELTILVN